MIVKDDVREISRSGDIRDTGFSVKATGKAFKILSSSLYKNKIRAIVRELSTNAVDAHVMVNSVGKPFDVHLPSSLEPYFSVRDYGPGLSEDDVYTIYTTYFESTKTLSNDFVGALGLGSKSPFSYTDSYTVISIHNRIKSVYTLYMNESDCPVVSKLGVSQPTSEPDGLEVKMSVKNADISSFRAEAEDVYSFFKVTPNILGYSNFHVKKRDFEFDGGFYRITKYANSYYNSVPSYVIMGNIAYPISFDNFARYAKPNSEFSRTIDVFRKISIEIDAPVGSVDFTAGREDLSYDEKVTVPYLLEVFETITKDYSKRLLDQIKEFKNEYEARLFYTTHFYDETFKLYSNKLKFNGEKIDNSTMIIKNVPDSIELKSTHNFKETCFYRTFDSVLKAAIPNKNTVKINASADLTFYIDDVKRSGISHLRNYVKQSYQRSQGPLYIKCKDANDLSDFLGHFPGVKTIYISSLIDENDIEAVKRKKTKVKLLEGRGRTEGYIRDLKEVDVDVENGGTYLISEFGNLKSDKLSAISYLIPQLLNLVGEKTVVYVVPISVSAKIVKSNKWKRLEELAQEKLVSITKNNDVDYLRYVSKINTSKTDFSRIKSFYDAYKNSLCTSSPITKLVKEYNAVLQLKKTANNILPIVDAFDVKIELSTKTKNIDLDNLHKAVILTYPMIALVQSDITNITVLTYINMCDNLSKRS